MKILISPSLLSCDFSKMGEEAIAMANAGADMLHFDVMDAHFVPNLTFGAPVIKKIRPLTDIVFDTHLMISNPYDYIEDFAKAGSDIITFHYESNSDVLSTINLIKHNGKKAGISVKPATSWEVLIPYLEHLDMVLIMTVEPGFGGQAFMRDMLIKITKIRELADSIGKKDMFIQVDGGISNITAPEVVSAGANVLVAGSALFSNPNYNISVNNLREAAKASLS